MIIKRIKISIVCSLLLSSFGLESFASYDTTNYVESKFTDNNYITRFEFVSMINETFNFENKYDIDFTDIKENDTYYDEVSKAVNAGYIGGYSDNTFKPNNYITREEVSAIISKIVANYDSNTDKISNFNDYNSISTWAKECMELAVENSYIVGYDDNTLKPKNNMTIKEAKAIIKRLKDSIKNDASTVLIENNNYKLAKYEPSEGTYLGAYVLQDELINADMKKFEEVTGKKHASYFKYLGYKEGSVDEFKNWMYEVKKHGSIPHVALEPNKGLDEVLEDDYLINLAKMFGEVDTPVFLRFASEMNGDWVAWNGNPKEYIKKWKMVHDVMEKYAPKVIMVWTPFTFPEDSIMDYYPGDEYVDWVGVNVYNVVYHNDDINQVATHEDPLELLDYVYDEFSHKKPIQISEYGATHYTTTDNKYYIDFAVEKINRMYQGILSEYPRIKSIFYFDVNNLVNAPIGRRINNYAITDEPKITNAYKSIISNKTFLEDVHPDKEGQIDKEIFTLKNKSIDIFGEKYINIKDLESILGGKLLKYNNIIKYELNGKVYTFDYAKFSDEKYFVKLDDLSNKLGFKIEKIDKSETLLLKK